MKNNFFAYLYLFFFPVIIFAQHDTEKREKMIIASYHSFIPQLSRYIEAKALDNIDCRIISVDTLDDFNAVKDKIDRQYTDFTADYLLLVGDFEHIPAFIMEEGLSDMHYTFKDENDIVPRMIVGRFSVETAQDLQTMIDRSLIRKPFSGHFIGIASDKASELTGKKDYEQVRLTGKLLQSKGFTSIGEFFDGSQLGLDEDGNPVYTDVISVLQRGVSWLNYAGYGSYEGWNTSGFENKHLDSLVDNVELPVIIGASCLGGHFAHRECFAEKWLRATKNGNPTGATAVIMSSSLADWDATLSAMILMNQNMPDRNTNCRLGRLYLQGYNHIINDLQRFKEACCWVLFGDPSLWIYSFSNSTIKQITPSTMLANVYPNPASSFLHIIPNGTVRLYDIAGKLLLETCFLDKNNTLDITTFSSGIYFLSIQNSNEVITHKLIIRVCP
ncbi:MAG: C25 family cysteine peptidase [Bacteroidales bacterium]|jgi:hypothetical protein|nr:C25 family cysteine peptidase [Bacteroidales bacterium]